MRSLNRLALTATTHCLTGCAIGEVLGMVLGTAFRWSNSATIVVSVVLAFLFGYGLTVRGGGERQPIQRPHQETSRTAQPANASHAPVAASLNRSS